MNELISYEPGITGETKYILRACYSFDNYTHSGPNDDSKKCVRLAGKYDTIGECYKILDTSKTLYRIKIVCACVNKFDYNTKEFNIVRLIVGEKCFENHPVPTEVDENKIYASVHHLILGKVIFCEHKDKSNKLLHVCYKLFDSKRLFAIYDAKENTLCVIDTEHPDVEEAVLKIYEKYNCIIDFASLNYLKNKIEGSTCIYKCRVK